MAKKKVSLNIDELKEDYTNLLELQQKYYEIEKELLRTKRKLNLKKKNSISSVYTVENAIQRVIKDDNIVDEFMAHCATVNPEFAKEYLLYHSQDMGSRIWRLALGSVLSDSKIFFEVINSHGSDDVFFDDERVTIYKIMEPKIKENHMNSPIDLYNFCRFFKGYAKIDYQILETLVKKLIGRKMDDYIENIIKYKAVDLPEDLMDQLNAYLVFNTLKS